MAKRLKDKDMNVSHWVDEQGNTTLKQMADMLATLFSENDIKQLYEYSIDLMHKKHMIIF